MSKYLDLDIRKIHELLVKKEITPLDLVDEALSRIEENKDLNAFITINDKVREEASELGEVDPDNLFFGIPIAVKDNIVTKDLKTTCASHILENFIPIYDATVVEKIRENKMLIIGKTNMDEFAMGSTSETSYFGAPLNPYDKKRVSGGSSGGSASAVSGGLIPLALGSDTGGSIRQPASYTGIVGMKPTYGRVSRYGLVAFASSLDQIGPMTRTVYENASLLNVLVGEDDRDLTSVKKEKEDFTRLIGEDIKGMKIALPKYFVSDIVDEEISKRIKEVISFCDKNGAVVDIVDMKYLDTAVNLYQIIAMAEASSNLARFDGVRYGFRASDVNSVDEMYGKTRGEGFGDEVKRRIMVGSYILSGENAKTYYDKALMVRDDITKEFNRIFKEYDLIIGPTTTRVAPLLGNSKDDPHKAFMDDVLVIPVNMAGLPALNIPVGKNSEGMPIGLHIIGKAFDEATIYKLASFLEEVF
ncbi:MAG TPA: Asp-tRNA(Asn)/Glu-tRNA(Gln) amidotransferase subunit GatA [Candidatus Onthousia excrementipullorum]|uniref:Glutamyl-tRNA(Gln) amidotransferase subunit A n=1 Tax=Candidatus Onthousia excrementipullorum TaxID=2840884 RepID=A0A9D1DUK2_9FIRM|nr:Asp-tRNA(Asn)/Glu-tRNA(Gln) amidotransferase subunit GatA [Candidatus Onthousia excrementipullorum]